MGDRVLVVGLGYVGLPLVMCAVAAGHRVVGLDVDVERVRRLQSGDSYVDDVSADDVMAAVALELFLPVTRLEPGTDFDVAIIAVPTPLRNGTPDLSCVTDAARMISPHLRPGVIVVLESTTYPGTVDEVLRPILEEHCGMTAGIDFHLGYSPERIDPGNRVWNLRNTPKIVSGVTPSSLEHVSQFYNGVVDRIVPVSGVQVPELTKLVENVFRHVNLALINELAMLAHALGIDIWEVVDAASTKPFGFMSFRPGPGVGGHCLPVDPTYLSWRLREKLGVTSAFIELANETNHQMPSYVVRRLMVALNRSGKAVRGARVLLLGMSYKANTGDLRESPSRIVARELAELGADVRGADPLVDPHLLDSWFTLVTLTQAELEAADAVVLLTSHDSFDYDLIVASSRYLLDTRGFLKEAPHVERL